MKQRWVLSFAVLSCLVSMILACARTSTTAANCPERTDAALLAGTFTVASTFFGAVAAVATCDTCAAGEASYYPDSGIVVPEASDERAIGGLTCENLCVCSADGTCFTRTSDNVNVVLYPFCDAGDCAVYAVVVAEDDVNGITNGAGTIITAAQQIDPVTLERLPVTSGRYPEITFASCSGCSTQTTC